MGQEDNPERMVIALSLLLYIASCAQGSDTQSKARDIKRGKVRKKSDDEDRVSFHPSSSRDFLGRRSSVTRNFRVSGVWMDSNKASGGLLSRA